tara:strand:- start:124 stop:327 length:204 start_codon:yes stop_codon:yes gene_type:complete
MPLNNWEAFPELLAWRKATDATSPGFGIGFSFEETLPTTTSDYCRDSPPRITMIDNLTDRQNSANIR